jgi:glycine oxidase
MRVLIIGAGIMGCATAIEIATRTQGRANVLLLERAVPGAEASSAAAGMLAAQVESHDDDDDGELRDRYVRARDAYAEWSRELRDRSGGVDIGYRRSGAIEIADGVEEATKLEARVRAHRQAGLAAEMLDGASARRVERELSPSIERAAYFPDEAQVDPPQLLRALGATIARASSIITKSGATVATIIEEGGRAVGAALEGGEILRADVVILAAGSWSSLVPGVPKSLPKVEPVRGQLALLEERPPKLQTIVFKGGGYVVPRGDGRVVCGSTMENVGHRREVTAGGLQAILSSAISIAPALANAELSKTWCNFRPHAKGGPLIGRSPLAGLFLATGHHRNGILLAKQTADQVADAILT